MKKGTIQKLKRILPVILVVCLFLFPVSARAASPRGLRTGMPAGGRMEKGEVSLPDIRVDKDTEYGKLREAVKTMDEMGLTPDKLLKSFWSFVSSPEERKKAGEKLDELRERVRKLIGGSSEKESGGKSEAEREKAESDPAEKSGKEPEKAES
ncbi:MAG: hypothetical protein Q4D81_10925, partial [Eubacteriales bacterium]|nr:hypothetical protein [Eubacteriales bacterium]